MRTIIRNMHQNIMNTGACQEEFAGCRWPAINKSLSAHIRNTGRLSGTKYTNYPKNATKQLKLPESKNIKFA